MKQPSRLRKALSAPFRFIALILGMVMMLLVIISALINGKKVDKIFDDIERLSDAMDAVVVNKAINRENK